MTQHEELAGLGIHVPELKINPESTDELLMQSITVARIAKHYDRAVQDAILPSAMPGLIILRSKSYNFDAVGLRIPAEVIKRSDPDRAGIVTIYLKCSLS